MSHKFIVIVGVVVPGVVLSLAGMRALSKRRSIQIPAPAMQSLDTRATSADRQIQKAEARIKNLPSRPEGYNLLAAAYMQKARETGDFGFNARAESALDRSLEMDPDDRLALTLHATLLLTYHRFREALNEAKRAEAAGLENADIYGVITDALVY